MSSLNLFAQHVEIVPMYGYTFQSTYYGYSGRIIFRDGMTYGGMINFKPNKAVEIGISILNQDTKADAYYTTGLISSEKNVNVGILNYTLSMVRNFAPSDAARVIPFAGLDIGVMQFYEKNANSGDYVRMSMGFKAGVKIQFSDRINFRIQPQLEMPLQGVGVGLGYGYGGASVGVTTFASFVQFGVMSGLGITIK